MRRRRWAVRAAAVVACAVLMGCGEEQRTTSSSTDSSSSTTSTSNAASESAPSTTLPLQPTSPSPSTTAATVIETTIAPKDQPALQLLCGAVHLPNDTADVSTLEPTGSDADAAWAFATTLYGGVDHREDRDWRVLSRSDTGLRLIAESFDDASGYLTVVSFTRDGDTWTGVTFDYCIPRWGSAGWTNIEHVVLDPDHRVGPDATELHLLAGSWSACSPNADTLSAVVTESAESVALVVLAPEQETAPGACEHDLSPLTVQLSDPLGSRTVVDASADPAVPLTLFKPDQHLHLSLARGAILGWWDADHGTWVNVDADAPEFPVRRGATLQQASLDGPLPSATAGGPIQDCEPMQIWTVALDPPPTWEHESLAVDGDWPILPRQPSVLSPTIAEYEQDVRDYLTEHGFTDAPVVVDQIVRVDLDGDGADEVIMSARHPDATSGLPPEDGYHSEVLLLRRVVGAAVETTPLVENLNLDVEPSGEYPDLSMTTSEVMAVGDLNGDGTMEIAVETWFFESSLVEIFDISSGTPERVLSASCGS